MSSSTKENFRRILQQFRNNTLKSSKNKMKNLMSGENRPARGSGMDEADAAFQNQFDQLVCRQCSAQRTAIKEIEAAMERLDEGSYGICEECGNDITEGRLRIVPFAKYCKDCQEEKELIRNRQ